MGLGLLLKKQPSDWVQPYIMGIMVRLLPATPLYTNPTGVNHNSSKGVGEVGGGLMTIVFLRVTSRV